MKPKSVVLYALTNTVDNPVAWDKTDYSAIIIKPELVVVPVRAQFFDGMDVEEALDHASPREGETVLNSIPAEQLQAFLK